MEIAGNSLLGNEQRQRFELFEFRDLGVGVGYENLRIFLKNGGHAYHGHVVGHRIQRHQGIRGHEEVELAGNQQHAVVVVRAAGHDGDVKSVFLVGAIGERLEKPAVLGFGHPVGPERDFVQRGLGARRKNGHDHGQHADG